MKKEAIRKKLYNIIFEADTPLGKAFDVALLVLIVISVILVMMESVRSLNVKYGNYIFIAEWIITILFAIEYLLRIWVVKRPGSYIFSFYGIIDLLSILPNFLALFFGGFSALSIIRSLRILRIFRIFQLGPYMQQSNLMLNALKESGRKITVFLVAVINIVMLMGSLMYIVEGKFNEGFSSIPKAVYWAIVTLTTVGYGDITPVTDFGRFLSAIIMILGYAIIAVPTGIVGAQMMNSKENQPKDNISCKNCGFSQHDVDAKFCKRCGCGLR